MTSTEDSSLAAEKQRIVQPEAKSYSNGVNHGATLGSLMAPNKTDSSDALHSTSPSPSTAWDTFSAHVNYVNAVIGSGIIAMPFALREAGLVLGVVVIVLVAVVTDISLVLLMRAGRAARTNTYQDTALAFLGTPGFIVCGGLQFAVPYLSMISYNLVAGDALPKVLQRMAELNPHSVWLSRELHIAMVTLLVTLPLSCVRSIKTLAHSALLSIAILAVLAISIALRVPVMTELEFIIASGLGPAQAIVTFGFGIHQISFSLYRSLDENVQRWNETTHASLAASAGLCIFIAIAGYVTFGKFTQGDLLENYCWRDDLMNVMRCLFVFTVLFTFPSECFAAREVIETSFFGKSQPASTLRHYGISLALVVSAMLLSFSTRCLAFVLQLTGLFFMCPLAFMLPSILFIKSQENKTFSRQNVSALLVLTFSIIATIAGITTLISDYVTLSTCSDGFQMDYCFTEVNGTKVPIKFTFLGVDY
ncbi:putative sodium-coupled neutral amino acid transporter 11 [Hyalella azteca]|uniref:Putative sodium-coupled neutral amino acid transporter 11 n=1 Tax=Hyalella azteca TaxID=294128 RepID=A0A8B7PM50_HYAAZ|nr:putative sodium-coupled neutral amino acid transporter 11 [Hyalella azteca]